MALPLYETVPRSEQLFDEDNYFPMNHLISYNKFETIGSKVHCFEFGPSATLQLPLGNFQSYFYLLQPFRTETKRLPFPLTEKRSEEENSFHRGLGRRPEHDDNEKVISQALQGVTKKRTFRIAMNWLPMININVVAGSWSEEANSWQFWKCVFWDTDLSHKNLMGALCAGTLLGSGPETFLQPSPSSPSRLKKGRFLRQKIQFWS